jgi:hypothetical protein
MRRTFEFQQAENREQEKRAMGDLIEQLSRSADSSGYLVNHPHLVDVVKKRFQTELKGGNSRIGPEDIEFNQRMLDALEKNLSEILETAREGLNELRSRHGDLKDSK